MEENEKLKNSIALAVGRERPVPVNVTGATEEILLSGKSELLATIKMGRVLQKGLDEFGRYLIRDLGDKAYFEVQRGRRRKLTEVDTFAFICAACTCLNKSSILKGNKMVVFDNGRIFEDEAPRSFSVSIQELCRYGYGCKIDQKTGKPKRPSTEQRKAMEHLIRALNSHDVRFENPFNGEEKYIGLCRYNDWQPGTERFTLMLHWIFCIYLDKSFFLLPENIMDSMCNKIDRMAPEHVRLLLKLSSSRGNNTSTSYTMEQLAAELGLSEYRKKNPGQAEKRIKEISDSMKKVGLALNVSYTKDIESGRITRIKFIYDNRFIEGAVEQAQLGGYIEDASVDEPTGK